MRLTVMILMGMCIVSGCASVNKADLESDRKAKEFKSVPEMSRIYVYRNQVMGSLITQGILVDDIRIGTIDKCSFVYKDVPPGEHKISTTDKGFRDEYLTISTKPNQVYFVEQEQAFGGITLNVRDENQAKPSIMDCSLASFE